MKLKDLKPKGRVEWTFFLSLNGLLAIVTLGISAGPNRSALGWVWVVGVVADNLALVWLIRGMRKSIREVKEKEAQQAQAERIEMEFRDLRGVPPEGIIPAMQELAKLHWENPNFYLTGIVRLNDVQWAIKLSSWDHELQHELHKTQYKGYPVVVSLACEEPVPLKVEEDASQADAPSQLFGNHSFNT
jgi:hypothetical protein